MVKFRTKYNPGSFSDNEFYEPGTSLTEPGQAESMAQLVKRMEKAELAARVQRNRILTGDATKLQDDQIDQLMSDADLDDSELERTEMAQAIEDFNETQSLLAGAGANFVSGSETGAKTVESKATVSETQTNSQTSATGFATESHENPRE